MSAEYLLAARHRSRDPLRARHPHVRDLDAESPSTCPPSPWSRSSATCPIFVDPSHAHGAARQGRADGAGRGRRRRRRHHGRGAPGPRPGPLRRPAVLYPEQFEKLMRDIEALAPVLGKETGAPARAASAGRPGGGGAGDRHRRRRDDAAWPSRASGAPSARRPSRMEFQEQVEPLPCPAFRDVFEAVLDGRGALRHDPHRELAGRLDPRELRPAPPVPGHPDRRRDARSASSTT